MAVIHKRIRLFGVVQGVGFRPFVHRLAVSLNIAGTVCNKGSYVEIEAEAFEDQMEAFIDRLTKDAPDRSAILKTDIQSAPVTGASDFRIIKSESKSGDVFVSPDIATCPVCRKEMYDPSDRRFRHPFINCTACGPRLTILEGMPYDRVRTSMKAFPMCPDCEREYTDPASRRFHAQPVACPKCGPTLGILYERGREGEPAAGTGSDEALSRTRAVIRAGGIAAIKGIGGFHLCCSALNDEAVQRLRKLKDRPVKPLAVMAKDIEAARRYCVVSSEDEKIMEGPQKPILLLNKRTDAQADPAPQVAPGNPRLGIMLPYAPVHYLIFDDPFDTEAEAMPDLLVMTSANRKGCPICRNDKDALADLKDMADIILTHDREIRIRADDSVMGRIGGKPSMIRRSRGYAPLPIADSSMRELSVLALGGELKNAFALTKHDLIYPSAYLSDMAEKRSVDALRESVGRMASLLMIRPDVVAVDSHPGYHVSAFGREYARERDLPLVEIQHHFAHVVSCMAENGLDEPVIGVSFDGTGYGDDGHIWGGEFFRADRTSYMRLASLEEVFQAGGDRASYEGWRPAVAHLMSAFGDRAAEIIDEIGICSPYEKNAQMAMVAQKMNGRYSSSMGRLFDAASAILGLCRESTFEGQAAMALQFAAEASGRNEAEASGRNGAEAGAKNEALAEEGLIDLSEDRSESGLIRLSPVPLIKKLAEGRLKGQKKEELALIFHSGISEMIRMGCRHIRQRTGLDKVVLSGGTMQNALLVEMSLEKLKEDGFEVYTHSLIPANDNGLAVGQAAAAAAGFRGRGTVTPAM